MPPQECTPCSEKDTLKRIEQTVTDMHKRLFVGNGAPSLVTLVDRNTEARTKTSNRIWDVAKLFIAAALPVTVLWLAGKL